MFINDLAFVSADNDADKREAAIWHRKTSHNWSELAWFLPDKEPAAEKTANISKKGLTSAAHWQIKRPILAIRQSALAQNLCRFRGHSSAGRAPALQAGGRRFDPVWLHQIFPNFF